VNGGDEITIELVPEATEEVRALIGELDRVLSAEYLPEQRHGLALDAIFKPDIRFFLARSNGLAMGCGGVAFFAGFAEVKRMYGRGVAQALLARIERETSEAGISLLRLETGVRQTAALRFYQRAGFRPCAAFGAYATNGAARPRHQRVSRKAAARIVSGLAGKAQRPHSVRGPA
jgi:putative acetyltransferase